MPSGSRGRPARRRQNVMPTSVARAATRSTDWSNRIPRVSSTSADPLEDDDARLPCLTTVVPVPATTRAAIVEMLTVCMRSPPVPTRSMDGPGTSMRTAWASIVSASAVNSATVSPLARRATRNPAIRTGETSPDMISSIAQARSEATTSCPETRVLRIPAQVGRSEVAEVMRRRRARPAARPRRAAPQADRAAETRPHRRTTRRRATRPGAGR